MIEYVPLEAAQALDEYVSGHPRGHYMQTTLWGRCRTDWDWQGIALRDAQGTIRASMALLSRRIGGTRLRQFYAPRGPVFDDPDAFHLIIEAASAYIRAHGGFQLRIDPPIPADDAQFRHLVRQEGFRIDETGDFSVFQARFVYQTGLAGLTEEGLLARFHPKTRYNIRLAQRRGVCVRLGTAADIPLFYDMMVQTAKRDGFTPKSEEHYRRMLEVMPGSARLYLAEKDGRCLAGAIQVIQGSRAWYAYGCSYTAGRSDMPNHLLQWEMMRAALAQGCAVYDFRGVEGRPVPENPRYGLHRFKQGFDSRLVEYIGQLELPLRPWLHRLIRVLQKLKGRLAK